jgi:ZIP family zinc transporter
VKALVAVATILLIVAGTALAIARPWRDGGNANSELEVTQATLHPGLISLMVENGSDAGGRIAQVILNDAFVDFRAGRAVLPPGEAETITLLYPWVRGEAYDIELLTSTGRTVDYEIEEAA